MEGLTASAAFWEHLRQLCLDQFPCGVGSWNNSRFPPRRPSVPHGMPPHQATLSFRSGPPLPPEEETVEVLTDFLRCPRSPWALPPDGSPSDQQLRELAVKSPHTIQKSFLCSYFRSLRIVNKGVTEIDAGLLQFPNVEELIVTANRISTINATNLPPGLKVLELCGNDVQSLKDLCTTPPVGLQHLGLGHNCHLGTSEEKYLTHTFWPNLVSLDLSYNNFTNLRSLLAKLLTLKKLRILILQGNPFALLSGYWGFTIDSLPKLSVFDDVILTPDEKHNFLDLSRFPDVLLYDVKLIVTIGKIRGVPNPVGQEEVENSPDASIITYSYYVTYEFAKGEKRKADKETVKHTPTFAMLNAGSLPSVATEGEMPEPFTRPDLPPETAKIYSTDRKPWAETIECDYRKEHLTRDLVLLKAFLLEGTSVSVIEEKIVSWPVVPTPEESPTKKGKGKAEKGKAEAEKKTKKEKEKTEKEGKDQKGKSKDSGKAGNKKKKKSPSPELRSDPPILKVLGSLRISLEQLLAGESMVETVCDFGILVTESSIPPPLPKEKDNKKGAKKDKKAKSGAESVNSRKVTPPGKGKGRRKDSPDGTDPLLTQRVPLTVEFQVQHIKWESASQFLRKNKVPDY